MQFFQDICNVDNICFESTLYHSHNGRTYYSTINCGKDILHVDTIKCLVGAQGSHSDPTPYTARDKIETITDTSRPIAFPGGGGGGGLATVLVKV